MEKIKTGRRMLFWGLLILVAGTVGVNSVVENLKQTNAEAAMEKIVIEAMPGKEGDEKKIITINDIEELRKNLQKQPVTCTVRPGETGCAVRHSGDSFPAKLIGADTGYTMFHQVEFIIGSVSPVDTGSDNLQVAAVSEEFAWELFKTTNAAGMTIEIYGKTFKITGVFRIRKTMLHILSGLKIPDVLIPARTMLELDDGSYIDSIQIPFKENSVSDANRNLVLTELRRMQIDETMLKVTDFNNNQRQMEQKLRIIVFLPGIITICLWCYRIVVMLKRIVRSFRDAYKSRGFACAIRTEAVSQIKRIAFILPALTLIFLIWNGISFKAAVPPQYIPGEEPERGKYVLLFQQNLQNVFSGVSSDLSMPGKLLKAAELIVNIMFFSSTAFGTALCAAGLKIINSESSDMACNIWKAGGEFILLLAIVAGLFRLFGLIPAVNINDIFVLWSFLTTGLIQMKGIDVEYERSVCLV